MYFGTKSYLKNNHYHTAKHLIAQAIGGVGWWGVPLAVRSFLCQYLFLVIAFKKEASDASDLV
jgi:hypothetical protein